MNLLPILTSPKLEKPFPKNLKQGELVSYLPYCPWLTFFEDSLRDAALATLNYRYWIMLQPR